MPFSWRATLNIWHGVENQNNKKNKNKNLKCKQIHTLEKEQVEE